MTHLSNGEGHEAERSLVRSSEGAWSRRPLVGALLVQVSSAWHDALKAWRPATVAPAVTARPATREERTSDELHCYGRCVD